MLDKTVPLYEAIMIRPKPERQLPVSLPEGYRIRRFQEGGRSAWAKLETCVGEFDGEAAAERHFDTEFGPFEAHMRERCLFAEDPRGVKIGTITAWYGRLPDGWMADRLHWFSVLPDQQGKGIGKALLSSAINLFLSCSYSDVIYLTTSTYSWKAVGLYRKYGFQPLLRTDSDRTAWEIIDRKLAERRR